MKFCSSLPVRALIFVCAVALCLCAIPAVPLHVKAADAYVQPGYAVDFSNYNAIDACYDVFNCAASLKDGAMNISFTDTGSGICADPYLSLALDTGKYSCEEYPYLALLVKTNKHDKGGQLRFRTASTGNDYPCQSFSYQSTNDWQVVVINLTDRSTLMFYPHENALTGAYTNLRLDMFDNDCPVDTQYAIKAYGLYKTAADAATFINYKSQADREEQEKEDLLNSVDYASFWMGTAFREPAMSKKMRWVTAGYTNNTATVDKLIRQGYGGFTSNVLYNQNYLQDDGEFAALKNVFDYAAAQGMNNWIYDEYHWPSGKAFGLVLKGHDEYEATGIKHHKLTGQGGTAAYTLSGKDIKVMAAVLSDQNGTRQLSTTEGGVSAIATGAWTLDVYVLQYTFEGVEDPTNFEKLRHVDLLNPNAVRRFIEVTHQQYKDKLGDTFDTVESFFTDEPQLGNRAKEDYVVWTPGLDQMFLDAYGYELSLPSLFEGNTDADRMTRMNYYQLVAALFKTSYIDQITAWCETNGTASSGHLLLEEDMNDHIETYGGDFLQFVGGMTIPGADILVVNPEILMKKCNIGNYMGLRYVTSAAKNAGKPNAFVEYNPDAVGYLPEDPMPASLGGASISRLLGCNVFHVINPQANYTNDQLNDLNNYVGRMNTILDEVTERGDIAVFYPIATLQALHNADDDHSSSSGGQDPTAAYTLNDNFEKICKDLLQNQYMFTVLDDETIRAATVTDDGCLKAGLGTYRVVILPYTQYISVDALENLTLFTKAGGRVIFIGSTPSHGLRPNEESAISALMDQLKGQPTIQRYSQTTLLRAVVPVAHRNLDTSVISGNSANLLMADYGNDDRDVTFLVNASYTDTVVRLTYTDGYAGNATLYHPETGYIEAVSLAGGKSVTIPACTGVILVREADNTSDELDTAPEGEDVTLPVEPDTTLDPVVTTQDPADTAVEPADTAIKPVDTAIEPADTAIEPAETADEPADTTNQPADTTSQPADTMTDDPETLKSGCASSAGMPVALVATLSCAFLMRRKKEN